MTKKTIITLLLCCCLMPFIHAQSNDLKKDSISTKSWEISPQFSWYFSKNGALGKNIFVRRNYISKKGKMRAWRFRLGADVQRTNLANNLIGDLDAFKELRYNDHAINAAIGKEWHRAAGKWSYYYGYEGYIQYSDSYHAEKIKNGQYLEVICNYYTTIGANAIVGSKYNLTPRLSIQLESVLGFSYLYAHNLTNLCYKGTFPTLGTADTSNWALDANLFPYLSFGLNYRFVSFRSKKK